MTKEGWIVPKHTVSCAAKCPYYRCEERSEIYCRGLQEGTAIHIGFAVPAEKKAWMKRFCKSERGFQDCRIKKMLESAGR